jgi:manganese transport protein
MYKKILIPLDNSPADEAILSHVTELARHFHSEILLLHVADGGVARNFEQLKLAESEEMKNDRAYLEKIARQVHAQGLVVASKLALGNPPTEIVKVAEAEHCQLIAMAAHGHRLLGDIVHGSTINEVRHKTEVPVLVIRVRNK